LGTLVLHGLALQSIDWGGLMRTAQQPPEVFTPGSSATTAVASAPLVLLDPSDSGAAAATPFDAFAAAGAAPLEVPVSAVDLKPAMRALELDTADDQAATEPTLASGDVAATARLVGIYTGQMQARIERLWRRPRSPVSDKRTPAAAVFHCEARVVQDGQGNVEEVLLPHCHGSAAWQRSLVVAIQQASPLPAPPDPKVFSRSVRLSFTGYPYRPGSMQDAYEMDVAKVAQTASH
jgi:hypothetical protein